jgi:hypothetical protein
MGFIGKFCRYWVEVWDLLVSSVDIGALNGLFVLGRSMGFIGKWSELSACIQQKCFVIMHSLLLCPFF